MNHPALLAALALAVILAVAWLSATLAERRRRDMQDRLTAVLTAAPGRSALSGLRRTSMPGARRGLRLLPQWLSRHLAEELGATGDRLGMSGLVLGAAIGAALAAGVFGGVLQWPLLVTAPIDRKSVV